MMGLPSPYVLLGGLLLAVGAFFYGSHVGKAETIAKQATTELLIAKAAQAAQQAAASEIAKIQITNKTVQGKVETITRVETQYRDCHNSPDVMRLLNSALSGEPDSLPAGGGIVPEAHPTH